MAQKTNTGDLAMVRRQINWTLEEWIVAVDFYRRHKGHIPPLGSDEIRELSQTLRNIRNFDDNVPPNTRNPKGVHWQVRVLAKLEPDSVGAAVTRHAPPPLARKAWEITQDTIGARAHQIIKLAGDEKLRQQVQEIGRPFGAEYAEEGQLVSRVHWARERNSQIIMKKKKEFNQREGSLYCEICTFNYRDKYGSRGEGFIECHHTKPLADLTARTRTHLEDLLLVCANCHRMIHRWRPWLSPDEMRGFWSGEP